MASATETVETFIAKKKVTQCNATTIPANVSHIKVFVVIRNLNLDKRIYPRINSDAEPIRYQTRDKESKEMSFPKMAVKP